MWCRCDTIKSFERNHQKQEHRQRQHHQLEESFWSLKNGFQLRWNISQIFLLVIICIRAFPHQERDLFFYFSRRRRRSEEICLKHLKKTFLAFSLSKFGSNCRGKYLQLIVKKTYLILSLSPSLSIPHSLSQSFSVSFNSDINHFYLVSFIQTS